VQQFDPRPFDEAQFQQAALELLRVLVVMATVADLDDHAAIAAAGLAQRKDVGHDAHATARPARLFDSDYQVRQALVHPAEASQAVAVRLGQAITAPAKEFAMSRSVLIALAALGVTSCSQEESGEVAPAASKRAEPTPAAKAAILAALPAPYNAADLDNGRRVFARCRSCHTITEGGPNMTGPNLYGVFGQQAGGKPDYNYSAAVRQAGFIWDAEHLDHWLENPRTFLKGTKMSFAGISDSEDRRDVIAFLKVETGYTPPPQP